MVPLALAGIAAAALAVCTVWLVRVPFLQQTDEQAHADYVYWLADVAPTASPPTRRDDHVTSEIRYLENASNFWELRLYHASRVVDGYGTRPYFSAFDRGAPAIVADERRTRAVVPYVATSYPEGYYVLAAGVVRAVRAYTPSLSASYFAVRALGIALLIFGTIPLSYAVCRAARIGPPIALMLVAALAIFPLDSWVSAYVQPDTLTHVCVLLVLLTVLRWRARPFDPGRTLAVGIVLAAAFFVKEHYAAALALAAIASAAASALVIRTTAIRAGLTTVCFAIFPAAAYAAAERCTPLGHLEKMRTVVAAHGQPSDAGSFARLFLLDGADAFVHGGAFDTYWFAFGDLVTPYVRSPGGYAALGALATLLCVATLVLFGRREVDVFVRIARVARRHPRSALALAFGDVILNAYVLWTILLLAVAAASHNATYLQGRYFLPMTLPAMLLSVRYLPRLYLRRVRPGGRLVAASLWLGYSLLLTPLALEAMEHRFYSRSSPPNPTFAYVSAVTFGRTTKLIDPDLDQAEAEPPPVRLATGARLRVAGQFASLERGHRVESFRCVLDGREGLTTTLGETRRYYGGLPFTDFTTDVPPGLRAGRHRLTLVATMDGVTQRDRMLEIDVVSGRT